MSRDDAEAFVNEVAGNDDFREELERRLSFEPSDGPDEETIREEMAGVAPALGAEEGYEFTAEEGFEALASLRERFEQDELSDDELERVAGGGKTRKAANITGSVVTAGLYCGFLSAAADSAEDRSCKEQFE